MIEQLNSLNLRQQVGQLFFIGIPGSVLDDETRELLDEVSPAGVCLFTRNIREPEQTRQLLHDIRLCLPVEPFLSLDQEGGLVDRLRRFLIPMPAAARIRNELDAVTHASLISEAIRLLGFNMNFAPVVDVITRVRERSVNGLYSRTFGRSEGEVAMLATAFFRELQMNGVIGCLKHFPGLGAAQVDSHEDLPSVDISEEELFETDLFPYRELFADGNVDLVMAAHASFPRVTLQETDSNGKLLPSSLSYNFITTLLRDKLGFQGVAITDDLEMGAILKNYGIGSACVMAINAGQDQLAICADPENIRKGFHAILAAVEQGEISQDRVSESMTRIARLKAKLSEPLPFNSRRLTEISTEIETFNTHLNR